MEVQSYKREYPNLELKELPSHLKYVFLFDDKYPVIISSSLTREMEERLLEVLRTHKEATGWSVYDIKVILQQYAHTRFNWKKTSNW